MQDPDSGCIVIALSDGDVLIGGQGGSGLGTLFFKKVEPGPANRPVGEYEGKSIDEIGPDIMVMFSSKREAARAIDHMINVLKGIAEHIDDPACSESWEG